MFHGVLCLGNFSPRSKKKFPGFRTTVARQEEDSEIETIEFEIPEIDDPDTETWEKSGRAGRGKVFVWLSFFER